MIKTSLIALMGIVALSAVPAFAMSAPVIEESTSNPFYEESDVFARLQERGIDAASVEAWGTLIRVFVRNDDGTEGQLFFDRESLNAVAL